MKEFPPTPPALMTMTDEEFWDMQEEEEDRMQLQELLAALEKQPERKPRQTPHYSTRATRRTLGFVE